MAVFLINVGVFLFRKNHNRNPPEPAKNLAEQTEKPVKTQTIFWHKKESKIKTMKVILQIWGALQF